MDIEILYEDEYLIFAVKPIGVLSQKGNGENMIDLLSQNRGEVYPVHRLDTAVGGVMVFAKTPQSAAKMSALVSKNEIEKQYLAVLQGNPEQENDTLVDLLFKDSRKNKSFVVKRERKGVKKASLEYNLISSKDDLSLVKVKLHTGRTHQIRVQFASRKLPLLGDGKYGSKCNKCSVALWSNSLKFVHPYTKKEIGFTASPPDRFPWNIF
ncbi:MAG: RluA family pseudouridine synthase [Clostridia bacterium]|nr:RluA family pseudouridine synthase [Clostridia bacterium]